jgi:hypothetical protein
MPAIPYIITVVGSAYYQPIADLVDKLAAAATRRPAGSTVSHRENGYAAACVVLLVAVLESFTSRVRFKRASEINGSLAIPDMLISLFPTLPTREVIHEVFLLRNIVVHNHLWHLNVSDDERPEPQTLASPRDLGFNVNKNYDTLVDTVSRRTVKLGMSAVPTGVGVSDVRSVFEAVWQTLEHMHQINYDHTPLAGRRIRFRGKPVDFESLLEPLSATPDAA